MSSKYQKPLTIPEGFPALLKGFTREILRAQPDNIYQFGAKYFADLLAEQSQSQDDAIASTQDTVNPADNNASALQRVQDTANALDIKSLSPAELEPIILGLFLEADADGSGYLDRHEFTAVLRAGNLNLTERQVRQILAEADENEDNVIQYKEFLPVMVDILQSIKAKEQAQAMMSTVQDTVRGEVENMLLHGMSQTELETLMTRVFQRADTDNSGLLNRQEFKAALKAAELGLTRKDINLILSQVDLNQDGMISYNEFIPVCFQVLVERFKDEIVTNGILSNADGLQGTLLTAFQAADTDQSGFLTQAQVKSVLKELSYRTLGLSTLQLVTLLSEAPLTPDGRVQYVKFVPVAAAMVLSMYDVDTMKLKLQAIKDVAAAGGMRALSQLDLEGLRGVLESAFRAADTEGTGQLGEAQVMEVLSSLDTLGAENMQLSDAHMRAMFAAIDADDSGAVDWNELVTFICDALEHLERENYINRTAGLQAPTEPQQAETVEATGEEQL